MDATYRKEHSLNGYALDELKSGLQKSVRRSDLNTALYCAAELDLFKQLGKPAQRIRTNFIHRLMIIFCEDIGPAGIDNWVEIDARITELLARNRPDKFEERMVCEIVALLHSTTRHRATSHWIRAAQTAIKTTCSWISDCDVDSKLAWLKWKGLVNPEDKLEYVAVLLNVYYEKPGEIRKLLFSPKQGLLVNCLDKRVEELAEVAARWYKELNTEREHIWLLPILTLWYQFKSDKCKTIPDSLGLNYDKNKRGETVSLPCYVYDKHTRKKAEKKPGDKPGWYVEPESPLSSLPGSVHYELRTQFENNEKFW